MRELLKPDDAMIVGLVLGVFILPTLLAFLHSRR